MTREEAIKTLKENYCSMCAYGSCDMDSCDISYCDNREAIEVLSAVLKREKGEWVTNSTTLNSSNTDYFCSKCGHKLKMDYTLIKAYQEMGKLLFCEHCGADMRPEPYGGDT